ncbi:MAG: uridine kinase [Chloroflexi bacterium]|nr:uridine kinase [Chloroflexota bacterium]
MTSPLEQPNAPESLRSLLDECIAMPRPQSTTLVGLDGRGGAGKSSLADALARLDPNVTIVHTDDFYTPSADHDEIGATIDWRRVIEQVLSPLHEDRPARYQRFDWDSQRLEEWHDVPTGGVVILDGVHSTRRELAGYLSYRIWVEVPRGVGMERGIARDGQGSRSWWVDEWMPDEDRYVAEQRPAEAADVVVDGTTGLTLFEIGLYLRFG